MAMRVLFVSSGNNRVGVTSFIRSQGESLIKAGVKLEYFLVKGKGIIGYSSAMFKLRRKLKTNSVDVLHAHYGLCGWISYYAKTKRASLVVSYMGSDVLPVLKGNVSPHSLRARVNQALQHRVDHVIVKSKNLRNVLTRKNEVSIIPNGVDVMRFAPLSKEECRARLGLATDQKIILFLGNPRDERKNITLATKAVRQVHSQKIKLFNPFPVDPGQVPFYINAAELLLVTSISEGSPNLVKEAMACNCPIVATDVGDIRWVVGDTQGCEITSFSSEDIARKIESVLKYGKRTNGRERILKLGLDSESIAKRIIVVYENVIKQRNNQ